MGKVLFDDNFGEELEHLKSVVKEKDSTLKTVLIALAGIVLIIGVIMVSNKFKNNG